MVWDSIGPIFWQLIMVQCFKGPTFYWSDVLKSWARHFTTHSILTDPSNKSPRSAQNASYNSRMDNQRYSEWILSILCRLLLVSVDACKFFKLFQRISTQSVFQFQQKQNVLIKATFLPFVVHRPHCKSHKSKTDLTSLEIWIWVCDE